ncbi:MAG: tRNA dihydrouridine(20/20a) synthase DusA [Mangrovicoccus sp.]
MTLDVKAASRLSVAPMMDWTDRHCRYFHRQLSRHSLLYTEMVTAPALVRGRALHLLDYSPAEQPVALQLGGSDPGELAEAAAMGAAHGYEEINLNVGCPSDRVQSGCFGAILMKDPALVARCVQAMAANCDAEITVKCRIGVDEDDPAQILPEFLAHIWQAGVTRVTIHARKAWLQGLSPKENREIPPLDYPLVLAMKERWPDRHISLNGGIADLQQAKLWLDRGLDGVMIGRAAYQDPANILTQADQLIFHEAQEPVSRPAAARAMIPYIQAHLAQGGRAHSVTRHMLGLFNGLPGARAWRRHLSEAAARPGAGADIIEEALALVPTAQRPAAE